MFRDRKSVLGLDFGRYSFLYTERSKRTALFTGGSLQPYEASGGNSVLIDLFPINNLSLIDSEDLTVINWNGNLSYVLQSTGNATVIPGTITNSTYRAGQSPWVLAPRSPLPQAHSISLPGKELLKVNWRHPSFTNIHSETPVQFSQELVDALQASPEVSLPKPKMLTNPP